MSSVYTFARDDLAAISRVSAHLGAATAELRQIVEPGLRSELGSLHAQLIDGLEQLERLRRRARVGV